ncbi:MAG: magnesium chelatase subunit H [Granulosicoccus sp.]
MHAENIPVRVAIITLDGHLGNTVERAQARLREEMPGLTLTMHPACDWGDNPDAEAQCNAAIEAADFVICTMMFLEPHINTVLPALQARAPHCDAMVGAMSGAEIVRLTRMGKLSMGGELKGPMAFLKKLRGSKKPGQTSGAAQMKTLKRLPKILKYIPGTAQDLRAYFIMLQCWLAGSEDNIACMVRTLVQRYAQGERYCLRTQLKEKLPVDYPENGLYHPQMRSTLAGSQRISARLNDLPEVRKPQGTVGVLLLRSYVLANNTKHYDCVIETLESRGLKVIPAFASGLDGRPAIDAYFADDGKTRIDCLISLTGFSLVGGPAYNDAKSAIEALAKLDVPYIAAHPSEFQSLQEWEDSKRGLSPIETTLMIALPELDGATGPIMYGGQNSMGGQGDQDKLPVSERIDTLAGRAEALIRLKRAERESRKLGIVLFNFPPNAGAVGSAAYLAVFESLHNTLKRLHDEGYSVDVPESADQLRSMLIGGNASVHGTDANVLATVPTDDYVRNTPWLEEIEEHWGPAPGKHLSNGHGLFILGIQLGNVTIALQPGFGYEGDPMRLLFEGSFAPTHAFCAFYRHLQHSVGIDALLHFGTHGALEFMPGKQCGLSGRCWPDRLIGNTPNFYFYAANNPSEATIAKRRSAATLISYLTPSVTEAGLYRGLQDIKSAIQQWNGLDERDNEEGRELLQLLVDQAKELDFASELDWQQGNIEQNVTTLQRLLFDYEQELIPCGLHVIGEKPTLQERTDLLHAHLGCTMASPPEKAQVEEFLGACEEDKISEYHAASAQATNDDADTLPSSDDSSWQAELAIMNEQLTGDHELAGMVHALDAGYIPAAPGGDLLHNAETLPAGRNLHGFDPFRLPTTMAMRAGQRHAELLLERHKSETGTLPRSIAFVLWGSDNLKNEGIPIAQVLALMGARPRFDNYGKLCGCELIPLEELGRPRIDVLTTLSGVFRDLLPLQTRMLAEAALIAAQANEPAEMNFIRTHTLAYQKDHGCDFATAALRVFSNADGAYGANVNHLIDSGSWSEESELADTYANRKCYAFGIDGEPRRQSRLLETALADVDLAYQNMESVELGVTQLDYYFDTLGGINSMVKKSQGESIPTYIGDMNKGDGTVRTLQEQVALETRTRMLNPKWYEGQLKHGYEGVRAIEHSITNTLGWSATTGQVSPWVYKQMATTFVLDKTMRDRLAELNPTASARMASRLLEASERNYWSPSDEMLQALQEAGDELEDRLEGVVAGAAA